MEVLRQGMDEVPTEMGTSEANHSVRFADFQSGALIGVWYEAEVRPSMTPYFLHGR